MDIQLILAVILGITAAVYVIRKVLMQFSHTEKAAKCDKCPAAEGSQKPAAGNQETRKGE